MTFFLSPTSIQHQPEPAMCRCIAAEKREREWKAAHSLKSWKRYGIKVKLRVIYVHQHHMMGWIPTVWMEKKILSLLFVSTRNLNRFKCSSVSCARFCWCFNRRARSSQNEKLRDKWIGLLRQQWLLWMGRRDEIEELHVTLLRRKMKRKTRKGWKFSTLNAPFSLKYFDDKLLLICWASSI